MQSRVILILLACLFVTACSNAPKTRPLYEGTTGVMLSFPEKNSLQLFEGEEFSVAVRLENDGTSDVNETAKGFISVLYDPAYFEFEQASSQSHTVSVPRSDTTLSPLVPFVLRGRSEYVSQGDMDYVDFTMKTRNLNGNRETQKPSLTFTACYDYTTTFYQPICVDRDVFNNEMNPVCEANVLTAASQGAPVAVTKVEPTYLRKTDNTGLTVIRPQYRITLQNVGKGNTMFAKNTPAEQLCEMRDFKRDEFDKVQVTAMLNNLQLQCGTSANNYDGITKFDRNQAQILCVFPDGKTIDAGSNYATPLIIKVHYFYISSVTAQLEVTQ